MVGNIMVEKERDERGDSRRESVTPVKERTSMPAGSDRNRAGKLENENPGW